MNFSGPYAELRIINSSEDDLPVILHLFDAAIAYQQRHGYELWPKFSEALILSEIAEKRHWKILDGDTIACIFSVLYSDPVIWGAERNREPAVYLHRIAVNPHYKGRGLMRMIRTWAEAHAREHDKRFVRMDTWGNNENLRAYYISCGFDYLGQQYLSEPEEGPAHYGGSVLSLFQVEV